MKRHIYATAPSRIDFAGGTLDIHPIYLFFGAEGAYTINAAINLGAEVWIDGRDDDHISISSLDTGHTLESDGGVQALPLDGDLGLITRVLKHYQLPGGMEVKTKLLPPHGSGLGASSTLFVALAHAALAYKGETHDKERIIRTVNNLEAQLMGMPAGIQDYYPPSYGCVNAIFCGVEGITVEPLAPDDAFLAELQAHIIVSYTNITHHSGTTNWGKIRNFFDKVPDTVQGLTCIKETADRFYHAFKARDLQEIAALLNTEWQHRRNLTDGVTTPAIDSMMVASREAGAWANKLCGAGGGGCMMTIAPPEARADVIAALESTGASSMDATLTRTGVEVKISDEAPVNEMVGCASSLR